MERETALERCRCTETNKQTKSLFVCTEDVQTIDVVKLSLFQKSPWSTMVLISFTVFKSGLDVQTVNQISMVWISLTVFIYCLFLWRIKAANEEESRTRIP